MPVDKQRFIFGCTGVSQENEGEAMNIITGAEVINRHYPHAEARSLYGNTLDDESLAKLLADVRELPMAVKSDQSNYIQELEGRHCKDTETIAQLESDIECLQERLKGAMRRCDENRSETLQEQNKRREDAAEAESKYHALLIESERRIEKLERQHEIEVKNMKHEIKLQDKALEKHAEDEKLIALLMKKGASYAERMVSE